MAAGKYAKVLIHLGITPEQGNEHNQLKATLKPLLDSGMSQRLVSAHIGYTQEGGKYLLKTLGLTGKGGAKEQACKCGCGRKWALGTRNTATRIWYEKACFYRDVNKRIANGELEPAGYGECEACGTKFPRHPSLKNMKRMTCSDECGREKRNAMTRDDAHHGMSKPIPYELKPRDGVSASRKVRAEYCHQDRGYIARAMCGNYTNTCGEGCYREDKNGNPCCYVETEYRFRHGIHGIDTTHTYSPSFARPKRTERH